MSINSSHQSEGFINSEEGRKLIDATITDIVRSPYLSKAAIDQITVLQDSLKKKGLDIPREGFYFILGTIAESIVYNTIEDDYIKHSQVVDLFKSISLAYLQLSTQKWELPEPLIRLLEKYRKAILQDLKKISQIKYRLKEFRLVKV